MITKVRYSKNPGKTIDYILNPKKVAHVVIARGVSSLTDMRILTEDFNRQCALRPSLKVKAVHIPISFHINDTATLEVHAEEIIRDWIKHMERHGYRFDQFIVGRHHDKDDKKATNKNENQIAETHNHRHQNPIEWGCKPASNEDTNVDVAANNNGEIETTSISSNLMEGITELIIQPTVTRIGTGSGSSDNTLNHDKDKNKQRKGGRRR